MIYELNTDEFYAYGYLYDPWASVNTHIVADQPIDENALSRAIEMAFARMPYFKVRLGAKQNPERYVLETNPQAFPLLSENDFVALDDERARDYLITITYFHASIRVRFSHALGDGIAINRFLAYLLRCYAKISEGAEGAAAPPPAFDADAADEREYDNPFDYLPQVEPIVRARKWSFFTFGEEEIDDTRPSLTRLQIPRDAILALARRNESSVGAVGAWLLMHTISRVKKGAEKPVSVAVPCDMRGMLGCRQSMRNCNIDLTMTMHPKMAVKPHDYQLTCLRGQMFAQTYEPAALASMHASFERWQKVCTLGSLEERNAYYHSDASVDDIPIVTYVGNIDLGGFEAHIQEFHQYVSVFGRAGILMFITCHHDVFEFNITSNLIEWDAYEKELKAFLEELNIRHWKKML